MNFLQKVKEHDPQNQYQVLIDYHKQIDTAWKNKIDLSSISKNEIQNIIICGLGGSAISGDLMQNYLSNQLKVPLFVNRNYFLPAFANENSLVIISSYSGNTEETISCFEEALKNKCKIVSISSGGKIGAIASANKITSLKITGGFQPRFALGLSFFSLLKIFQSINLIPPEDENVNFVKSLWQKKASEYAQEDSVPYRIAEKLIGYVPIIYSADGLTNAIGYRFKCQLNENSKMHAFHNVLPELNHNEIIGWETFNENKINAKLIFLLDEAYQSQIIKRFEITTELVQKSGGEIISLQSDQLNIKVRIMDLIYLCDWISFYLAMLRGFDPSEIDYIHDLKKKLQ